MAQTTARWEGNILMVRWFGGAEDEAAELRINWVHDFPYLLVFEGMEEDFRKRYRKRPKAEEALADILEWQAYG